MDSRPFTGSSTTGIAGNLANRRFLGIDQEKEYLDISKNRKEEIENIEIANLYRNKISGFITAKQFNEYLIKEPQPKEKVALGFCRKKDIPSIINTNKFYFHAIGQNNQVKDFPTEILEAQWIYLYEGGRSSPKFLTGHFGLIAQVKLKHKSKIQDKENSLTEFYYEVTLKDNFCFSEKIQRKLDIKTLFDKHDLTNKELFKKFLPSITTKDKVESL